MNKLNYGVCVRREKGFCAIQVKLEAGETQKLVLFTFLTSLFTKYEVQLAFTTFSFLSHLEAELSPSFTTPTLLPLPVSITLRESLHSS